MLGFYSIFVCVFSLLYKDRISLRWPCQFGQNQDESSGVMNQPIMLDTVNIF